MFNDNNNKNVSRDLSTNMITLRHAQRLQFRTCLVNDLRFDEEKEKKVEKKRFIFDVVDTQKFFFCFSYKINII